MTTAATPLDDLLSHAGWARKLARALVRDDAAADDLVQEAYSVALKKPPDADRPARPWLAQVMRNLFRMRLREARRRGAREESWSADPETPIDAESLTARVQQQRQLAVLVLGLDEPFRTTLMLRFYEELDAGEIARRLDTPAGTIRWRLKASLERLREKLDGDHGGDRHAWQLALAPLGGIAPGASTSITGGIMLKVLLGLALVGGGVGTAAIITQHAHPAVVAAKAPKPKPFTFAAPGNLPKLDQQQRTALLEKLDHARSARTAADPAGRAAKLDKDYIQDEIKELLPLVKECFESALERKPNLSGKIVVRFTIVGEPEVGGLVGESTIEDRDTTITDHDVRECIANSMFAAQFPPPDDGGEVVVSYPFVLVAPNEE